MVLRSYGTATTATDYYPSSTTLLGSTSLVAGSESNLTVDDGSYMILRSYGTSTTESGNNPTGYLLLGSTSLVDGSESNLTANDASYMILGSYGTSTTSSGYYPSGYTLLGSTSVVDGSESNLTANDASYLILRSYNSANITTEHYPSGYTLVGSTVLVDGSSGNLTANDQSYLVLRSYATGSSSVEYAHVETRNLGSNTYYELKVESADTSGTNLTASATTAGRTLLDKFVYPLSGVSSIASGNWTLYYRACTTNSSIVAHMDVDVLVRQANDTVRQTIATDVANSANVSTAWATLSGNYSFPGYTVVNQTDYLEVDFYADITTPQPGAGNNVVLRIDDNGLSQSNQTRMDSTVPTTFTAEAEFEGSSNTYDWTQLVWNLDSAWTVGSVNVTIQVYNYTLGDYPSSGDGYLNYISSSTANTDETKNEIISASPEDFRNASGNWKIKIKGVKSTTSRFDLKADWFEYKPTYYNEYSVEVEFSGSSNLYDWTELVWNLDSAWTLDSVTVTIQVYNYTLGDYPIGGNGYASYVSSSTANTDETKNQTIAVNPEDFRDSGGNWKVKIKGVKSTTSQHDLKVDWIEYKPTYYNEYAVEVEFFGTSNTFTWTQLNWTIDSGWTVGSISATIQVYNYTLGGYPSSGNGYMSYTSSSTPNTDETRSQSISVNPQHFRNGTSGWRIRTKGSASTTTQFNLKVDWIEYEPTYYKKESSNPEGYSPLGSTTWVSGGISNLTSNESEYMVFRSYGTATTSTSYNPSGYNLLGSTAFVGGTTSNLAANDGSYMIFRSYVTGTSSTEYAHVETETIGGVNYYKLLVNSSDSGGTSLSVPTDNLGRFLFGKFIYPLSGISSIPSATWTFYYRTNRDGGNIGVHCDVDILIRMANNTLRETIATNVANSTDAANGWSTLSGTYSWSAYNVVNQTDYLEIDFYGEVTNVRSNMFAYLRIDDNTLSASDQTRVATSVPADFVSEVEFAGSSNLYDWAQIDWSVDSAWTVGNVSVIIQLYNYTLGDYPSSGDGYLSYTSSSSADTDEIKNQTISTNPEDFRNATGYWKIKIRGMHASPSAQFDFKADWIEFKPAYYNEWTCEVEFSGTSNTYIWTQLDWTIDSAWTVGSTSVILQLYNYTLGDYPASGDGYTAYTSSSTPDTDETKYQLITSSPEDFRNGTGAWKIKVRGVASATTQFDFKADWITCEPTYHSEFKVETEFIISGVTSYPLIELNLTAVSQYDVGSAAVTIQVYNYSSSSYVTGGEGYLNYTSSATPDTDETKIVNITTNIEDYVSSGNSKIKVTGIKTTTTQFQQKANQVKLDFDEPIATSDHYPSSYTNSTGAYISGNVPASVKTVDSDYFVTRSVGTATSVLAYNPSGYSLLNDTLLSSGAIGDVSSSNDNYMVFTAYNDTFYKTAISESESTISGTTSWQDKAVLTWNVPIADNYLVYATAEITEGATNQYVSAQLTIDGTTYGTTSRNPYNTGNYQTFSAVKIINLNAASHTAKIQYRTSSSPTVAKIKNARIIAMRIGSYYQSTEVGSGGLFGDTYQDAAVLTWTPSSAGNWLIITNLETYNSDSPRMCYANLLVDGVQYHEGIVRMYGNNDRLPQSTHKVANLGATSHTLKIQVKSSAPSTVYYRNLRLYAIDLDSVGSTYQTQISEAESTYSTDTTYQTKVNLTWTPSVAANYLIIATAELASSSTSVAVKGIMQIDSITYGNSIFYPYDVGIYGTFVTHKVIALSPTSHTITIRYATGTAGTSAKIRNARITALRLPFPAESIISVEFTGSSNTYDVWQQLNLTCEIQFNTANASATIQLWNYNLDRYSTSGEDGYLTYTSSSTPNTDENKTETTAISPHQYFRNTTNGNWKIKLTGVNTAPSFTMSIDWIEYKPTHYTGYNVSTEFSFSNLPTDTPVQLNFTVVSQYDVGSVQVTIQVFNYSSSSYVTSGEGYQQYTSSATAETDETTLLFINTNPQFYTSSGNAKINITAVKTTTTQFQKRANHIQETYVSRANNITFDYVLAVVEQDADPWKIRLQAYSDSNIGRLQNCTIYFYNSTDGTSTQIYILNGAYSQQTGPWYNLDASETIYIAMTVEAESTGTSHVYAYLEIRIPGTTTYLQYKITFEIT